MSGSPQTGEGRKVTDEENEGEKRGRQESERGEQKE